MEEDDEVEEDRLTGRSEWEEAEPAPPADLLSLQGDRDQSYTQQTTDPGLLVFAKLLKS